MQYREKSWYASQNIFLLKPKEEQICGCFLYIIGTTNKALRRFNGGYNDYPTISTLKEMEIYLPQTPSGEIDYGFMETYISAVKKQVIGRLREFIRRERDAYMQVIGENK